MGNPDNLDAFLSRNHISQEQWQRSGCNWEELSNLKQDYEGRLDAHKAVAELFANSLQKIPEVHSVRWRLKNSEHLLEKIVRKCAEGSKKYLDITVANYSETITDLVGVRALHLFKEDCLQINRCVHESWRLREKPIAYIRQGDDEKISDQFKNLGMDVKHHPAGYRSVHYILQSQAFQRTVYVELQVRTIFEEGWSEIDHKVRYPYFTDNELVNYFLRIFNRLAGSADEMGDFVNALASTLRVFESQLEDEKKRNQQSFETVDEALAGLALNPATDNGREKKIAAIREEVNTLRQSPTFDRQISDVLAHRFAKVFSSSDSELAKIIHDQESAQKLQGILDRLRREN